MPAVSLVWYVAYGSNTRAARFDRYLAGGTPEGAARCYPGCRDRTPPRASVAFAVPGGIYFATRSPVWGGGRAFYDPALPGTAAVRAYLITVGQFSDVAAQEMYREPGETLDLAEVLAHGRVELGPGRYETLLCLGERDGHPLLTFTAPWSAAEAERVAPSAAYLATIADGLRESHGWDDARTAAYLSAAARA
ncbi:histone deacetylase [Actinosynnema sp. NPDC020468]|uniref:histone deacetylase n=1 Tax=Actinosynnema sp. NPDC020468 TaxID=3154488 RepID=UPI0033D17028